MSILYKLPVEKYLAIVISKAREYIDNHFTKNISLEEVAKVVHLNPAYFSRLFKHGSGENFTDYIEKLRMKKAIELIETGNYKIYEISILVGYGSSKYFNRQFKKYTGYTPREYFINSNIKNKETKNKLSPEGQQKNTEL